MADLTSVLQYTAQAASEIATTTAIEFEAFERLLQSKDETDDIYTQNQQISLGITQRIAGALSLLGGVHIFWRAYNRRSCAFDRIMLGLSIQTILSGIYHLWGNAAVPVGTPDVYGAHGNVVTCTAQGFLIQVTMVVPFYYVFLSCYSWAVVMQSNFDPSKYEWIERYMHVGVHIFPLGSAIYLLEVEGLNSNGLYCWIASLPHGCGDDSGIECTRGPQNPRMMLWIFAVMPAIFFLAFPTVIMVTLTLSVYLREKKGNNPCEIPPAMVAKQSAVYLGSLYWVYLPLFVYSGLYYFQHIKSFAVAMWVSIISVSLGLWFAIVYWYFTTEDLTYACEGCDEANAGPSTTDAPGSGEQSENTENDKPGGLPSPIAKKKYIKARSSKTLRARQSRRISFNIFDGTASGGEFSSFIFHGDSDDEEMDLAESKQWEMCQEMNQK